MALSLLLPVGAAHSQGAPVARPSPAHSGRGAHWRDRRLAEKQLTLEGSPRLCRHVLTILSQQGGVPLRVQPDWGEESVGLAVRNLPLAAVMDSLAATFGGQWHPSREGWTLAVDAQVAQVTLMPKSERVDQEREIMSDLVGSLTRSQQVALSTSGKLPLSGLSAQQRQLMEGVVFLNYYDPSRAGRMPLILQPVSLAVVGKGSRAALWIMGRTAEGKGPFGIIGRTFINPSTGERLLPFDPPQ